MRVKRRTWLIMAVAVVAAAFAVPALAQLGVNAQLSAADDDIPGVVLPASPVTGDLDGTVAGRDYDDVYAVRLNYNERLSVQMSATAGTDFDLQLWRPGSPNLLVSNPLSYIVQASSNEGTSTEEFWYPASTTGTYSLDVLDWAGTAKGTYRLTWDIVKLPEPGIATTMPATVKWGGGAKIEVLATDDHAVPLPQASIMIASRPYGGSAWTYLNMDRDPKSTNYGMPKNKADALGALTYTVYPTRLTEYRAIVWPSHDMGKTYGAPTLVSPRATITTPKAPDVVYGKRSFTVSGYLMPKHKKGATDVKIRFYSKNKDGSWTWRKTVMATNYTSTAHPTYTLYSRKTYLPFKGSWKILAYIPGDTTHTERTSAARYLTVK
ncbi:MAG: hypothetical protein CVT67_10805 [Actinobacteria bacterium HGW-Actinobacteria-7]|jgi:hypothetical protein|nr:MAG: hypothetical protein CVT67_10805 [Actinobacteria bacterium HGW-Actinobacteria-7]